MGIQLLGCEENIVGKEESILESACLFVRVCICVYVSVCVQNTTFCQIAEGV